MYTVNSASVPRSQPPGTSGSAPVSNSSRPPPQRVTQQQQRMQQELAEERMKKQKEIAQQQQRLQQQLAQPKEAPQPSAYPAYVQQEQQVGHVLPVQPHGVIQQQSPVVVRTLQQQAMQMQLAKLMQQQQQQQQQQQVPPLLYTAMMQQQGHLPHPQAKPAPDSSRQQIPLEFQIPNRPPMAPPMHNHMQGILPDHHQQQQHQQYQRYSPLQQQQHHQYQHPSPLPPQKSQLQPQLQQSQIQQLQSQLQQLQLQPQLQSQLQSQLQQLQLQPRPQHQQPQPQSQQSQLPRPQHQQPQPQPQHQHHQPPPSYQNRQVQRRSADQSSHRQRNRRAGGDNAKGNRRAAGAGDTTKRHPAPKARDEEAFHEFNARYALQGDEDSKADYLRLQANTTVGVIGTLDVEHCSRLIAENDVTIVVTDTGTGKSTLIPKAIIDSNPEAKIVNTQPRRTPAINLAQRVAELYGEKVGTRVGYWVRGEHVGVVGVTPIMYVTNYTLFLHLLHMRPEDAHITHVIFDEFHERTVEIEVLLLMMKLVMQENPGKLKLILCSATAEVSQWACFFENMTVGEYSSANAMYPVHSYNLEDVSRLLGLTFSPPVVNQNGVVQSVQLHTIIFYIKEMLKLLAATAAPQHSILIFAPGRTVVEQLVMWIRENLGDQLDPIPWYRDIELSFIQENLQRESVTKKKVYVATDIAEVSLTLPDVVFVIDSGTAKRPHIVESSPNSVAFPPLELVWESTVNLLQRRGRVGRVQQGFFFTMLSESQIQQLQPSESRLVNAVIHGVVLHCIHLTHSPLLMFSLCREEPRKASVQLSLATLCGGGYIVPEPNNQIVAEEVGNAAHIRAKSAWSAIISSAHEKMKLARKDKPHDLHQVPYADMRYSLTLKGIIVGGLPLGVEPGTIVFNGLITGLTTLSIIAAACVSCNTPFYVPYRVMDRIDRLKEIERVEAVMRGFKGEMRNDALAAVGAVIAYMAMQREGLSEEGQAAWCEERYLSRTRIIDILLVVRQTKEQLAAIVPFEDVTDVDELSEQYELYPLALSLMCSAAHMHHGIYVLHDAELAQKRRFAGSGVFVNINCCRDRSVPTSCPWDRDTVCVPFTLQTMYGLLLGSFSAQMLPEVFNVMLLLFAYHCVHEEINSDATTVVFEVSQCGNCVYLSCDRITALQLLQVRRLQCARLCIMQFVMKREANSIDTAAIVECLDATGSDFGIPAALHDRPELIASMITSSMTKIVQRIEKAVKPNGNDNAAAAADRPFCRVAKRPPDFRPTRQSTLLCSGNGCAAYEGAHTTRPHDVSADTNTTNAAPAADVDE